VEIIQLLFVLKCIHGLPETVVGIPDQLFLSDESLKRFMHEFFTVLDIFEDRVLKNKIASVDSNIRFVHIPYLFNKSLKIHRNKMAAHVGLDAKHSSYLVTPMKMLNQCGEMEVR